MGALSGHIDRYNGIRIADEKIETTTTPEKFKEQLMKTVKVYKGKGFHGVWLKL